MPMYEFVCRKCGKDFEQRLSMAEAETGKPPCPGCGSRAVEQQLSSANIAMGGGAGSFESGGSSCSGGGCCCN